MGWLYGWDRRKDLIDHLVGGNGVATVAHCLKGNNLWVVHEHEGKRWVCLYLIRGRNGHNGWGYKELDETMAPYYYNCPLSYIDMCEELDSQSSRDWRASVRKWHAAQKAKSTPGARLSYGGVIYVLQKKIRGGWNVVMDGYSGPFRMTNRQLSESTLCPPSS